MGTWGVLNFENDGAADFAHEVMENGKGTIKTSIEAIINSGTGDDNPEAPECEEALAAIEFIAAAKGNPSSDCAPEVLDWIKSNDVLNFRSGLFRKKVNIEDLARTAIDRISTDSEMKELWEDSDEYDEWQKVVLDLKERIK